MRSALLVILLMVVSPLAAAFSAETNVFAGGPRLLTNQQLDSLEFRARFHEEWISQEKEIEKSLRKNPDDAELTERIRWRRRRRAELKKSPIGVFLPKTEFHLDEPAYAYFVVKNVTDERVGLDMRLDLHLRLRTVNASGLQLRRLDEPAGELVSVIRQHCWECGGPPRLTLPPGGYYCTRADLRQMGASAAGEYALRWNYSGLISQEVKFEVLPARKDGPLKRPIHTVGLARIERGVEEAERIADPPPPPVVHSAQLNPLRFPQFAAALSTSDHGRLYPDVFDLPRQDRFVSASLHLEMPRDGGLPKTLVLTLTPRQKNEGLFLADFDNLVLMVMSRDEVQKPVREIVHEERLQRAKQMERGYSLANPDKPLKIRLELEQDWQRRFALSGPVELRLILSSQRIELQGQGRQLRRLESKVKYASGRRPWQGLLCTQAIHLDLPRP